MRVLIITAAGDGVRGPAARGAVCAAITTYLAVKFILRFLETNRLTPFGIYCVGGGAGARWRSPPAHHAVGLDGLSGRDHFLAASVPVMIASITGALTDASAAEPAIAAR